MNGHFSKIDESNLAFKDQPSEMLVRFLLEVATKTEKSRLFYVHTFKVSKIYAKDCEFSLHSYGNAKVVCSLSFHILQMHFNFSGI